MLPIPQQEIPHEMNKQLGTITNITFPRQGHTSDVGIIESAKGIAVLKRARGKRFTECLKRETYLLECLSLTHLRVPKIYHYIEQEVEHAGIQSWLLMEYLPGQTLRNMLTHEHDSGTRYTMLFDFGKSLREIHSTPCPDELKIGGKWLDRILKQAEYNLGHYQVDGSPELLEKLIGTKLKDIEQTLIHGDFTIDNVLVHAGRVSGILDWSGGAYGDPRYDVSLAIRPKPHIFQSSEDHRAFFDGYGEKIITDEEYEYFEGGVYAFL